VWRVLRGLYPPEAAPEVCEVIVCLDAALTGAQRGALLGYFSRRRG